MLRFYYKNYDTLNHIGIIDHYTQKYKMSKVKLPYFVSLYKEYLRQTFPNISNKTIRNHIYSFKYFMVTLSPDLFNGEPERKIDYSDIMCNGAVVHSLYERKVELKKMFTGYEIKEKIKQKRKEKEKAKKEIKQNNENEKIINKITKKEKNEFKFIIPKNINFYNVKYFHLLYNQDNNLDWAENFLKVSKITYHKVEHFIKFLQKYNIITVIEGKRRKYVKENNLEDISKSLNKDELLKYIKDKKENKQKNIYRLIENGKFRYLKVNHPMKWNEDIDVASCLEDICYLKFAEKDYLYQRRNKFVNIYRDKNFDEDKKQILFNSQTLKPKKLKTENGNIVKRFYEFYKSDNLEKEMRELNKYFSSISPLFRFQRIFGKNSNEYGRVYSPYTMMKKSVRNIINEKFKLSEEIDIKSCAPNTLCIAADGDFFRNPLLNDDIYMSVMINIPGIRNFVLRTQSEWEDLKIDYSKFIKYEGKLLNIEKLKQYRFIAKRLFMCIYGSNTQRAGIKSVRKALVDFGIYLPDECGHIKNRDLNKILMYKEKYNKWNQADPIKDQEFEYANYEKWKKVLRENDIDEILERFGMSVNDVHNAFIKAFGKKYSNSILFMYTNIYPFTQNIESEVLIELMKYAKENNHLIGMAHDCIYTNKENASFYKEYQTQLLKNITLEKKDNLFNLYKEKIFLGIALKNKDFDEVKKNLDDINSLLIRTYKEITQEIGKIPKSVTDFESFKDYINNLPIEKLKKIKKIKDELDFFTLENNKEKYEYENGILKIPNYFFQFEEINGKLEIPDFSSFFKKEKIHFLICSINLKNIFSFFKSISNFSIHLNSISNIYDFIDNNLILFKNKITYIFNNIFNKFIELKSIHNSDIDIYLMIFNNKYSREKRKLIFDGQKGKYIPFLA